MTNEAGLEFEMTEELSKMPDEIMVYPETGDQGIKYWCVPDQVQSSWNRQPTKYIRADLCATPDATDDAMKRELEHALSTLKDTRMAVYMPMRPVSKMNILVKGIQDVISILETALLTNPAPATKAGESEGA